MLCPARKPRPAWLPRPATLRRSLAVAVALVVALPAVVAQAGVAWHADVATARSAAAASRRPLCVVFVADRTVAEPLAQTPLADPAAEALLTACFEPVCADVRSEPDLARRLVVSQVPMLYILMDDNRLVTAFPMPASAADFVTVAAKVAQEAAAPDVGINAPPGDLRIRVSPPPTGEGSSSISVVTGSVVNDKFQRLSQFANESDQAAASWPAERPATALVTDNATGLSQPASPQPAPPRPAIEPAATAPWLAGSTPQTAATAGLPMPGATAPLAAVPPRTETPAEKPAGSATSSFIQTLQKPFTFWGSSPAAADAPAPPPTMPPARSQPFATTPSAPAVTAVTAARPVAMDPYGSMPLGLEGFCPVTLLEKGSWTEGRPQWGARHRGRTYLFAGQSEQQAFLANPDRYAPALSGDDPVLAFESGTSMPGQRRYGVTYQTRMYLFSSPETRAAFTADPMRYASRIALAENSPPAAAGPDTIRRY
jgi:YHS domain-containing protein